MKPPLLVLVVCALAMSGISHDRTAAQSATESDLLKQLELPRTAFTASLDLARLYRDQMRTDEAVQMLTGAIGILRAEQHPTLGGRPISPPPLPAGVPLRVGGDVLEPRKIRNVVPAYPESGRKARLYGAVQVEFVIDTTGAVGDVRVLRSCPPFDDAAVQAVKRWRYEPTFLNGIPVPVLTTAVVGFWP
jgi:TonB family protein